MAHGIRVNVLEGYRKVVLWSLVIFFSALSCLFSVLSELRTIEHEFTLAAWEVQRAVIQRVVNLEAVLTALVGYHQASDSLSRAEQTLFSQEMLKAYPYIHSILLMERVSEEGLQGFEERMREEGFVSFKLQRVNPSLTDDSNGLGFHLPISFIEPMEPRTANLLGFDLAQQPSFSGIIEKVVKAGDAFALEAVRVSHLSKSFYFILKPVYLGRYPPTQARERWEMFSGFVALRIDFERFFRRLELPGKDLQLILYRGDRTNHSKPTELLAKFGPEPADDHTLLHSFNFTRPLEVHGLSFTLSEDRWVYLDEIDWWKVAMEWLTTMMVLLLVITVYRNRRYAKLQEEATKAAIAADDARLANVIETAFDAVITADSNGRVVSWNKQAGEVFGYEEKFVLGLELFQLILTPESLRGKTELLAPLYKPEGIPSYRARLEAIGQDKNGREFPLELAISSSLVGGLLMLSVFARDITELKRSNERIRYLAYCDSLTDLPNRQAFKEQVSKAIESAMRYKRSGAILYLDLDEFKRINDTLGHNIGDLLLQHITMRLVKQVRGSDTVGVSHPGHGTDHNIARLGGDEFTVLLQDIEEPEAAEIVAKRVQGAIARPCNLNGHEVYVTPSIGIAIFPRDGQDVEELLKNADTAMYHAKAMGKNNYQFYSEQMNVLTASRLKLEGKLRRALAGHEMELYYQPQIDILTGELVSAEALLRWHQPELGMITPDEFIPIAEETGMIIELGEWVINEACRQNRAWQDAGHLAIRVAVNLSSMQFIQRDLNMKVARSLKVSGLEAKYLELEITESILMRNVKETISTLNEFKEMGIRISVDDFGTGYSSLSYLKRFPLDMLKVDRAFVRDIPKNQDDMTITSAIIAMAHRLNLGVVAEGVETQSQIDFLRKQGCEMAQGYLFSKPLPANEFVILLSQGGMVEEYIQ